LATPSLYDSLIRYSTPVYPGAIPDTSAAPAEGDFEDDSLEGGPHLDEELQPAEEPTAVGDREIGSCPCPAGDGIGGDRGRKETENTRYAIQRSRPYGS
jgi:hypothetical protein